MHTFETNEWRLVVVADPVCVCVCDSLFWGGLGRESDLLKDEEESRRNQSARGHASSGRLHLLTHIALYNRQILF